MENLKNSNGKKVVDPRLKVFIKAALGLFVVLFTGTYFFKVTFGTVHNENIAYLVIGYMGGLVTAVTSYYFGSSEQDDKKEGNEPIEEGKL